MAKKILIAVVLLIATLFFAGNQLAQRAPRYLRGAIEKALNKPVIIESIEYHFPGTFELGGFEIQEGEPFANEQSFYADQIRLWVSPLSLSSRTLVIDKIDVENASILIRKRRGKLFHALSSALQKGSEVSHGSKPQTVHAQKPLTPLPLEIRQFVIKKSNFKFIDYDAQQEGFVIVLDEIDASLRDLVFPFSGTRTSYKVNARLSQGRDQQPGHLDLSGWTVFNSLDTDAILGAQGVYLPYFRPYYAQVTPATIEDGYLDAHANLQIKRKELSLNVDLEIINLLFENYEAGNQLFGLKADEILSFLKDSSGRLKLQLVAEWNIADRSTRARSVIRKSIERSLRNTILGNVGNILERTIEKISERGMGGQGEGDLEGVLKKAKALFR